MDYATYKYKWKKRQADKSMLRRCAWFLKKIRVVSNNQSEHLWVVAEFMFE